MNDFSFASEMHLPRAQEINLHARKMARAQARMVADYKANAAPLKRSNGLLLGLVSALVLLFGATRRF